MRSRDPATGTTLGKHPEDSPETVERRLRSAVEAQADWRTHSVEAGKIETSNAFVTEIVKSDSRGPFGGLKASGYGSELGAAGLCEFTNTKTIWIEEAADETGNE